MYRVINRYFAQSPAEGALETLYAAVADLPGGTFVGPSGRMGMNGAPRPAKLNKAALDPGVSRRLWDVSAELTEVRAQALGASESPR
jgi:hypothetical protein